VLQESAGSGLHMLIVEPDGADLTYQYMYREDESAPPMALFRTPFRKAEAIAISDEIEELLCAAQNTSPGTEDQLQRLGGRLCDALIPGEQSRFRKFGQGVKWRFCSPAA
jgi:hypothetical protein